MLKKIFLITILISLSAHAQAAEIPISVSEFANKAGSSSCRFDGYDWWWDHLGDAFSAMTQEQLTTVPGLVVLERDAIDSIYMSEVDLINSNDQSVKRGGFKKAKYSIVGTVTQYEFCASSNGGSVNLSAVASVFGVSVPDVSVGMESAKAKVTVQLRLVDVESGRILRTASASGESASSKMGVGSDFGSYSEAKNSPVGEASKKAIADAVLSLNLATLK